MPHSQASQIRVLPTYGIEHYGTDVFLPLHIAGHEENNITISTAIITQSVEGPNNATAIEKQDDIASNINTISMVGGADDTALDFFWRWHPDMSAIVYKTTVQIAICLNVSAFTSGAIDLEEFTISLTEGSEQEVIYENTFFPNITPLTSAIAAIFIFHADILEPFKVFSARPIEFRLQIPAASETGVSTTQTGFLPIYPYLNTANLKSFTQSGITFHIHASLDHADPVMNRDLKRIV